MKMRAAVLAALPLLAAGRAFCQSGGAALPPGYSLQPPALTAPSGAPGAVRRAVMQFYHWTLLCDETAAEKKRVCNVTQTVRDAGGRAVFSWSLAGSDDGKPFLLLRALPQADTAAPLLLRVKSTGETAAAPFVGCNEALCLGQTPVGPVLARAIKDEAEIELSYKLRGGGRQALTLPLRGLRAAVAAIN